MLVWAKQQLPFQLKHTVLSTTFSSLDGCWPWSQPGAWVPQRQGSTQCSGNYGNESSITEFQTKLLFKVETLCWIYENGVNFKRDKEILQEGKGEQRNESPNPNNNNNNNNNKSQPVGGSQSRSRPSEPIRSHRLLSRSLQHWDQRICDALHECCAWCL